MNAPVGMSVEEINSVLLVLLCNKLGITHKEIEEATVLYLQEQAKVMMMLDTGEGKYNA